MFTTYIAGPRRPSSGRITAISLRSAMSPRAWWVVAFVAAGCDRGGTHGRAAAAHAPVAAAVRTPASDVARPPPAVAAPRTCRARPASAFHLRPTSTPESTGPEFPAGTEVDVLGLDLRVRHSTRMIHARVPATGAAGYLFV